MDTFFLGGVRNFFFSHFKWEHIKEKLNDKKQYTLICFKLNSFDFVQISIIFIFFLKKTKKITYHEQKENEVGEEKKFKRKEKQQRTKNLCRDSYCVYTFFYLFLSLSHARFFLVSQNFFLNTKTFTLKIRLIFQKEKK